MQTVDITVAARQRAAYQAPIHIAIPTRAEYLRRLAHVAAQWPDRRPAPVAAPAWAPALVSVMQAALQRPVIVRGMP
jgi:hypothetical protein